MREIYTIKYLHNDTIAFCLGITAYSVCLCIVYVTNTIHPEIYPTRQRQYIPIMQCE